MLRRLHASRVFVGDVPLDAVQGRHARDVLRLAEGTTVEVFDRDGNRAVGTIRYGAGKDAVVIVGEVTLERGGMKITVASAIPKGERADWMVEKLSELGVAKFIPLSAERSVTVPAGKSKFERWNRIATESAKQSRRAGVMAVEALTSVSELIAMRSGGLVLSTAPGSTPLVRAIESIAGVVLLVIGPEGGWTEGELRRFSDAGYVAVGLTESVLRTETAAVIAAGVVAVMTPGHQKQ